MCQSCRPSCSNPISSCGCPFTASNGACSSIFHCWTSRSQRILAFRATFMAIRTPSKGAWMAQEHSLHIMGVKGDSPHATGPRTSRVWASPSFWSQVMPPQWPMSQAGLASLPFLNKEAQLLYYWLLPREITMLAVHCPGVDNPLCRKTVDSREWSLN